MKVLNLEQGSPEWKVGDTAHDDLTGARVVITSIEKPVLPAWNPIYLVDSDYLSGERYGWELTPVSE